MRIAAATIATLLLVATVNLTGQRGPAPTPLKLDPAVLALACAPTIAYEAPLAALQITGGQESFVRRVYAPGDLITINAGRNNGIEAGQEFYVRRLQVDQRRTPTRENPGVIRTTGWIKVWAVDDDMSLVTVTHACETIDVGDYLEPFALPVVPEVDEPMPAQRDNYGRILIGNDRRRTFARGDFMLVDRGSDHGVTPGARFVVYRDKLQAKNFLYDLGEAVAVDVKPDTSTLLVTVSRDAFKSGDYVALRRLGADSK